MAKIEHDDWVEERRSSGWVFGNLKDSMKKASPYLIPYDDLSEEVKDIDHDAVSNIPKLLDMVDLAIFI